MRRIGRPAWLTARRVRIGALALVALGVFYVGVTFLRVIVSSNHDDRDPVDAIVVLGAAQYNGEPSPVLERRLDHALELWEDGVAPLLVTTGSNIPGDVFTEGYTGLTYLLGEGVPEEQILVITTGDSTWEQVAATARQLRERGLESVVLVSDPYHSLRLEQIADEAGLDGAVSPTDGGSSIRQLARETAAVSLGQVIGYRRIDNWLG